jgi:hypothetical protein
MALQTGEIDFQIGTKLRRGSVMVATELALRTVVIGPQNPVSDMIAEDVAWTNFGLD